MNRAIRQFAKLENTGQTKKNINKSIIYARITNTDKICCATVVDACIWEDIKEQTRDVENEQGSTSASV